MAEGSTESTEKSDKNTIPDWKSALSGALNDTQLTFALVVLFAFFGVYILFDGFFVDNNRKDVDVVKDIQNGDCNCKGSHRSFYIAWFTICSTVWVVGPFMLWIFQWCNCYRSKLTCTDVVSKFHSVITWIVEKASKVNSEKIKKIANAISEVLKLFKIDDITGPLKKIEDLKWLEYYNLHVAGADISTIKLKKIKKKVLKVIGPLDELSTMPTNQATTDDTIDGKTNLEDLEGNYCCGCTCLFYVVCSLLEIARIIGQRATVPFLMIQAFDTYAFLCFTGNQYCTATAQYDIPLGQAAFTFAFSVSIMVSTLTVAMLKWFMYQRKKFLCCCKDKVKCSQYKWMQSCV